MKMEDALAYINEIAPNISNDCIMELAELLLWAYDKGWQEGIED